MNRPSRALRRDQRPTPCPKNIRPPPGPEKKRLGRLQKRTVLSWSLFETRNRPFAPSLLGRIGPLAVSQTSRKIYPPPPIDKSPNWEVRASTGKMETSASQSAEETHPGSELAYNRRAKGIASQHMVGKDCCNRENIDFRRPVLQKPDEDKDNVDVCAGDMQI
eukprot:scaffold789_cov125-Isochrysis_galbana.AAC.7